MKFVLTIKSQFSFKVLYDLLHSNAAFNLIRVHEKNMEHQGEIEEIIEEQEPNLHIVDSSRSDFRAITDYLNEHQHKYIIFEDDFEQIQEKIMRFISDRVTDNDYRRKEVEQQAQQEEKIVYRERYVEKPVVKTEYKSIPKKLIAVLNFWQGAGSTTVATSLARGFASQELAVSVVESPTQKPYLFDYLQIGEHEELHEDFIYTDLAKEVKQKGFYKMSEEPFHAKGIDWYVNDSRAAPVESFSQNDFFQMMVSINTDIQIFDLSTTLLDPMMKEFLKHMDHIYVVVEADPVKLDWLSKYEMDGGLTEAHSYEHQLFEHLELLEQEGYEWEFVLNKFTKDGRMKEFLNHIPKKPLIQLPPLNHQALNDCIWGSRFLYDEQKEDFDEWMRPAFEDILPKDFTRKKKQNDRGLIKKLIKSGK